MEAVKELSTRVFLQNKRQRVILRERSKALHGESRLRDVTGDVTGDDTGDGSDGFGDDDATVVPSDLAPGN